MTTWRCPQGHDSSAADWCDVCGAPIGADAPPDPPAGGAAGAADPAGPPGGGADTSIRIGAAPATGGGGDASAAPTGDGGPSAGAGTATCPHCGAATAPDLLFCEACGADLTTGAAPPPPPLAPSGADQVVSPGGPAPAAGPTGGDSAGGGADQTHWVAELWVDPDWYAVQDSDEPCPSAGAPVVVPLRGRSVLVGRPSASRNIRPEVDCGADTGVSRRHAQLTTDGQRWWVEDLQSANGTFLGAAGAPLPTVPITAGQRREVAGDERIYLGAWTRLVLRAATDEERASF
jgi:hypothetical protein